MGRINGNISSGTNTTEKMGGLNAFYDFHIRRNFYTDFLFFLFWGEMTWCS